MKQSQHFVFLSLEKIEEIDISNNYLFSIDHHAFEDLDHLRKLRIDNNQLVTFKPKWVSDGLFSQLNEGKCLKISTQKII